MRSIPYDSLVLMAASREMSGALAGGRVQKVVQPAVHDIVLTVRNRGANYLLALSADPAFARAYLTVIKRPGPPEAPPFCMACRKHLEGGNIRTISQRGFDRILDITVEHAGRQVTLTAELMGKHSNLILVSESGMVLDAVKRITRRQSRFREVIPGARYLPPPSPPDKPLPFDADLTDLEPLSPACNMDSEALAARIGGRFFGISPFLAEELARRAAAASAVDAWEEVFGEAEAGRWAPVLVRDERGRAIGAYPFPSIQFPAEQQHPRSGINLALDHYYGAALPLAEVQAASEALGREILRALKQREKKAESLVRSLAESGRAEEYRRKGELLLASLHRISPDSSSVTVEDYFAAGTPAVEIPLDPDKSAQENAESYFRRYRKARDAAVYQRGFLQEINADLKRLADAADCLKTARDAVEIRRIRRELAVSGALRYEEAESTQRRKIDEFQGKRIRRLSTPEGWEVLVGENSEANDFLTSRVARPDDIWLHVRSAPSAHVIIRSRNDPQRVPMSVIRRAAILAAQHSASKHSSTVAVDYTLKKHVRRPRKAAPGTVLYQNEKTIHVSPKGA